MKNSSAYKEDGSIFNSLATLPLLKGVAQSRLQEIVGTMKLHFRKLNRGEEVVGKGSDCRSLLFVLNGKVRLSMAYDAFSFGQTLEAPQVISPEHLFGLTTTYPCSVSAITDIGLMEISKEDFRRMLALDPVFLFNYLNTVCARAQRSQTGLLAIAGGSTAERLAYWITTLSQPEATDIELRTQGRELHHLLGVTPGVFRAAIEKLGSMVQLVNPTTLRAPSRAPLRDLIS